MPRISTSYPQNENAVAVPILVVQIQVLRNAHYEKLNFNQHLIREESEWTFTTVLFREIETHTFKFSGKHCPPERTPKYPTVACSGMLSSIAQLVSTALLLLLMRQERSVSCANAAITISFRYQVIYLVPVVWFKIKQFDVQNTAV